LLVITEMKAEAQLNLLSSIPRRVPATVHELARRNQPHVDAE